MAALMASKMAYVTDGRPVASKAELSAVSMDFWRDES